MARSSSSEAPDQRPTELVVVSDHWIDFSSGDFDGALDETVRGPLLPPASAPLRIVVGKPTFELTDEIALREVVDVLGGALEDEPIFPRRDRTRWRLIVMLGAVLAAAPVEPLGFLLEQVLDLGAALLVMCAEIVSLIVG